MILGSETAQMVGMAASEFALAASSLWDVDQRKKAVSTIQNSAWVVKPPLEIFGRKAVWLLHPFDR
jgi:hypothetical protein